MIDGFYTLNIALQDLIGQPQFEMVISFRVSFHKNEKDMSTKPILRLQLFRSNEMMNWSIKILKKFSHWSLMNQTKHFFFKIFWKYIIRVISGNK